jgi:lipopolysaccharide transport system ATP-binding protein
MSAVLKVENVSKLYRLGEINRRMLYEEVQSFIARLRGKEDPNSRLGAARHVAGESKEFWALRDIDFTINEGESVGIIGRNGAGKSTLLKILSEITLPTTGRVLIKGRVASLLEVGTGFHPELTGRENVYLNGAILGMTHREVSEKFAEIAEFSGVEEFLDTPVKRYSSGMRVRLAFAVAAHLDPEILVIDEVLAVGDAAFQQKCLGKLGDAAQKGKTVIFVSHNMVAIESLCRRALVLHDGRVVFDGSQTEAIDRYLERVDAHAADLAERTDRRGSGDIRFTRVEFRDLNGKVVNTLASGQDLDVVLHFRRANQREFPQIGVFISVRSHFEVAIFHQNNQFQHQSFGPLPETGAFVCRLRDLPLPAGHYRLNVGAKSQLYGGDMLDQIDDAAEFTVEGGDFFGSGFDAAPQLGACLVRGDWRLLA